MSKMKSFRVFIATLRSLIKIRKSKGPRTEPEVRHTLQFCNQS